jgi:hypothetical protein
VDKRIPIIFVMLIYIGIELSMAKSILATNLEDLSVSVAYLQESSGPKFNYGTGFLVTSKKQYLVTAAHVARFITPKSVLTMRNPGDVPITVAFEKLFPSKAQLPWHLHPEADVAVLELQLNHETFQSFTGRFLHMDMLFSDEAAPQRERPLVAMGFPLTLGTGDRFSPITVEAKAASGLLRLNRLDTNTEATFFVLDKPSIGGYSGAPIYLMPWPYSDSASLKFIDRASPEAKPKCVGIVHGTTGDNTGGKLAVIVPSVFVVKLIREIEESGQVPK